MKKIFLVFLILFITLSIQLNALLVMNDIVPFFQEDTEKSTIEYNIIEGAVHFLKSKSYSDNILMEYEKSAKKSINYPALLEHTENAIIDLESSKEYYIKAKEIGERIGYKKYKRERFMSFDYDSFIEEMSLNKEISSSIKEYLSKGDVIGLYKKNISNIEGILDTLHLIKEKVKFNTTPDISIFWKLLKQYSETALFGNYSTIIGRSILGIE